MKLFVHLFPKKQIDGYLQLSEFDFTTVLNLVYIQMADENVSKEISIEENGTLESVNGNEEHSDVSSMQKDDEEEGKGDGLLFNDL